jgi:glycerophosphoryl diester phosphodiesterase
VAHRKKGTEMDTTALTQNPVPPREGRPLVLGHRGAVGPQRAENTVRSVAAALERGADGVELDVRLSADGVLVCSHDPVVPTRLGPALEIRSCTWRELRRGSLRSGGRLARLEEVLEVVDRERPARLVVEAKPVSDPATATRTAAALRSVLAEVPDGVATTVSSFDWSLLSLVRDALDRGPGLDGSGIPGSTGGRLRTAAVVPASSTSTHTALRHVLDDGHDEVHLGLAALRRAPHVVRLARQLGVGLTAWTVNGRDDLLRLARWGVDAVITDNVVLAGVVLRMAAAPASADLAAC